MRKTISWLITLTIVLGLCPVMAVNAAWDGQAAESLKAENGVYLISSAAELKLASDMVNGGSTAAKFKLTADIDYENNEWIPFSHSASTNYSGTFDGDGYVVKNLKITNSSVSQKGFFGQTNGATIKNLGIENMTISISDTANGHRMGVLVCRAGGTITNCYVKNSTVHHTGASGEEYGAAGFVGSTRTGTIISDCYVYGTDVKGCGGHVGAFLGQMEQNGTISNCYVAETTVTNTAGKTTFAFGNRNGKSLIGTSYSTLTPIDTSLDIVSTSSDKTAIISALVTADGAYASHSSVNDGYPYLKTQKNVQPEPTQAPTPAPVKYAGGTGTEADPYLIETAQQLLNMNDAVNSDATEAAASYKLIADIDFGGNEWLPLGRMLPSLDASSNVVYTPAFKGKFDGNGHVVNNIKITIPDRLATTEITSYTGFFGRCEDAKITDFGLRNMIIEFYNHDYVYGGDKKIRSGNSGVMAGYAVQSTFENCFVENSAVRNMQRDCGDTAVGGFVGAVNYQNTFKNCYVYNTRICAGQNANMGGFFGYANSSNSTFENCFAAKVTHDISGTSHVSIKTTAYGFGNRNSNTVTATNCYSTMADSQGTHFCENCICVIYNKDNSVGKTAATAKALCDALLDKGVYLQNAGINGGYPYLNFGSITVAEEYAGGSGTQDDPFLISNAGELKLASDDANSALGTNYYFKLTNDIDYGNNEWTPIGHNTKNADGTTTPVFMGGFDGDGHVIRNLKITNKQGGYHFREIGFFGYISNATVSDLGLENVTFEVYNGNNPTTNERINNMGGFAGLVAGSTKFTNCYIKNSSVIQMKRDTGENGAVGGFVGTVSRYDTGGVSYYPTFENCYVYRTQLASGQMKPMGGFFGKITYGGDILFKNCYVAEIDHEGAMAKSSHKTTTSTIYGFGTTDGTSTKDGKAATFENCYSTLSNSNGNHSCASCVAPAHNPSKSVGVVGATKSDIQTAFANTSFLLSDEINGGYPYLSFEKPDGEGFVIESVQPGITKVTAESYKDANNKTKWRWQTEADDTVSVTVKRKSGVTDNATVYVASYDSDGRLISADSDSVTANAFKADVNPNGVATIKVFVWDGNNSPSAKIYLANPDGKGALIEAWEMSSDDIVTEKKTRLVLMGDSIVDNVYHDSMGIVPRYGWEGYIGKYLNDDITLIKHGHGSQTVKDFIVGRNTYHYCDWKTIKKQFGEGDYVILALGHNDEKAMTNQLSEGKNFTVDEFKAWYKQIISDVKAKGAKIILLTPTPANDSHKDGQYYAVEYTSRMAILELASEADVDVIDMTQKFADRLNKLMEDENLTTNDVSTSDPSARGGLVFVDRLHMGDYGADLLARTIAEEIAKLGTGLEDYVK